MNQYMITFPSITKASHAQNQIRAVGYVSTLGKSPAGLLQTCGYALYLEVKNIDRLTLFLSQSGVGYSGIYLLHQNGYQKIR